MTITTVWCRGATGTRVFRMVVISRHPSWFDGATLSTGVIGAVANERDEIYLVIRCWTFKIYFIQPDNKLYDNTSIYLRTRVFVLHSFSSQRKRRSWVYKKNYNNTSIILPIICKYENVILEQYHIIKYVHQIIICLHIIIFFILFPWY